MGGISRLPFSRTMISGAVMLIGGLPIMLLTAGAFGILLVSLATAAASGAQSGDEGLASGLSSTLAFGIVGVLATAAGGPTLLPGYPDALVPEYPPKT